MALLIHPCIIFCADPILTIDACLYSRALVPLRRIPECAASVTIIKEKFILCINTQGKGKKPGRSPQVDGKLEVVNATGFQPRLTARHVGLESVAVALILGTSTSNMLLCH